MLHVKSWIYEAILLGFSIIFFIIALLTSGSTANILFLIALILGALKKGIEGILDTLLHRRLNVELLMIAAAAASFYLNMMSEAIILILIFGVSGMLESFIIARNEKNLTALLDLTPKHAQKVTKNAIVTVSIDSLVEGDVILLKPGELLALDSTLVSEHAVVDLSKITGESLPLALKKGEAITSGAIINEHAIHVRVQAIAAESTLNKITTLLLSAKANPAKISSFIERFETIYVWFVVLLALSFYLFGASLFGSQETATYKAIMVLVVGSPCALVASISPAILAAVAASAKNNIFIKNGKVLEQFRTINHIVFDKTKTLTTGQFVVKTVNTYENHYTNIDHFSLIYALESLSSHPLALAISTYIKDNHAIKPLSIEATEIPGIGLYATYLGHHIELGKQTYQHENILKTSETSLVFLCIDQKDILSFQLEDQLLPEAALVSTWLQKNHFTLTILTGDHLAITQKIARELQISNYHANCLPEDKAAFIEQLSKDQSTLMIGDGFNDALALKRADISIATSGATDVALEVADIILMQPNLHKLVDLVVLSRRFWRIILTNLIFSATVIIALLITNVFFDISLPLGVSLHEGSTLLVILNGLRLLLLKRKKPIAKLSNPVLE